MKSFRIEEVKEFMALLLSGSMFDRFQVTDVQVKTFVVTNINGGVQKEWLDEEEELSNEYVYWAEIKPLVFNLVKGKKTPTLLLVHFIHMMENGDTGAIRVQYEKDGLRLITAYSQKEFALDKSKEYDWDESCRNFIQSHQLSFMEEK